MPNVGASPLVSILLPSYNYGRYIAATIRSVLEQTYSSFELIISDDASTDDSRAVIAEFRDPRIRFFAQSRNLGNIDHFAWMYSQCRGDFLAYIDSDDQWDPHKLERQIAAFTACPALGLVGTYISTIDAAGQPLPEPDPIRDWFNTPFDPNDWASWIHKNRLCMSSILARKSAHDAVGVRAPGLTLVADWDLWLRFRAKNIPIAIVPEPLTRYRVHDRSMWAQRKHEAVRQHVFISQATLHPALRAAGAEHLVRENFRHFLHRPDFVSFPAEERAFLLSALGAPSPSFDTYPKFTAALAETKKRSNDGAQALLWAAEFVHEAHQWLGEVDAAKQDTARKLAHVSAEAERLQSHTANELDAWRKLAQDATAGYQATQDWNHSLNAANERLTGEISSLSEKVNALENNLAAQRAALENAHKKTLLLESALTESSRAQDELRQAVSRETASRHAAEQVAADRQARIDELSVALDTEYYWHQQEKKRTAELQEKIAEFETFHRSLETQPLYRAALGQLAAERWQTATQQALQPHYFHYHFTQQFNEPTSAQWVIKGWAFLRGALVSELRARVVTPSSEAFARVERLMRQDVAHAFPDESSALDSGCEIFAPLIAGENLILIEGRIDGTWVPFFRQAVTARAVNLTPPDASPGMPLVSVVIPCFNYGRFVRDAIDSALQQTWPDVEVIVVDDGSTEAETISVLDALSHPRVRLIRTANAKLPAARNRGIREARGTFICCLDADDRLAPTYIEKCLVHLFTSGDDICGSWQQNFGLDDGLLKPGGFSVGQLWAQNRLINAAVFSRVVWAAAGGYDESLTEGYEDWDFWVRCARAGACAHVLEEPLFFYRKHGPSMIDATQRRHDEIVSALRSRHYSTAVETAVLRSSGHPGREGLARLARLYPKRSLSQSHVLLALPWTVLGGVDTLLSQICARLAAEQIAVTIYTTEQPLPEQGDTSKLYSTSTSALFHLPRFLPSTYFTPFVSYLLETRSCSHLWLAGSAATYEMLSHLHHRWPQLRVIDSLFNTEGHTANNRRYAHHIDVNLVESVEVREWLLERGEWPERVQVVPNGVDLRRFQPQDHETARAALPAVLQGRFVVAFFGRFSREKAPDLFVELAARFYDDERFYFVMAGGGPLEAEVRALAESEGLFNRLLLPGVVDASVWLPAIDALVLPSRLDGRPNSVLEALACGTPVLASRVGGLPELITCGVSGELVEPENVDAMERILRQWQANSSLMAKLRQGARAHAEHHLDLEKSLRRYLALFSTGGAS